MLLAASPLTALLALVVLAAQMGTHDLQFLAALVLAMTSHSLLLEVSEGADRRIPEGPRP